MRHATTTITIIITTCDILLSLHNHLLFYCRILFYSTKLSHYHFSLGLSRLGDAYTNERYTYTRGIWSIEMICINYWCSTISRKYLFALPPRYFYERRTQSVVVYDIRIHIHTLCRLSTSNLCDYGLYYSFFISHMINHSSIYFFSILSFYIMDYIA